MYRPFVTCPECRTAFDALAAMPWGSGRQESLVLPIICGECAAILLLNVVSQKLVALDQPEADYLARVNPTLWKALTEMRARIMQAHTGMPDA